MLRSIKEIKGYRIFSDFTWPDDLHRFEKFNLIYGLNGSGKTTLTTIFSNLAHCCPSSAKSLLFDFDSGLDLPRCSGYLEKKSEFLHGKVLVDLPECSLCDHCKSLYSKPRFFLGELHNSLRTRKICIVYRPPGCTNLISSKTTIDLRRRFVMVISNCGQPEVNQWIFHFLQKS